MAKILHVGCGNTPLPDQLQGHDETRLDIDPGCKPDIVASITNLGSIGRYDLVYSCHCLEHLYPYDVPRALKEFRRVLEKGGKVVIRVPDLEDVRATEEVLYDSPAGPITGLDMIYGLHTQLEARPYMAHHSGFVKATLEKALRAAGFSAYQVTRDQPMFELQAVGVK